jgi:hypothetical protein
VYLRGDIFVSDLNAMAQRGECEFNARLIHPKVELATDYRMARINEKAAPGIIRDLGFIRPPYLYYAARN